MWRKNESEHAQASSGNETKLDKIQKELADTIIEVNYKNNVKVIIDGQQRYNQSPSLPKW